MSTNDATIATDRGTEGQGLWHEMLIPHRHADGTQMRTQNFAKCSIWFNPSIRMALCGRHSPSCHHSSACALPSLQHALNMIHHQQPFYLSLAFCNIGSFDSFALQPSIFTLSSPDDYNPDNSDPLDRAIECFAKTSKFSSHCLAFLVKFKCWERQGGSWHSTQRRIHVWRRSSL